MSILDITRFIRGYVEFEASGSFPERLIILSLRKGLNVYDTRGSGGTVKGRVPKSQFEALKRLGSRCGVDIRVIKTRGVPFIYMHNRRRSGLVAGALCFAVLCYFLTSFVWVIDVEPTSRVSEYEIRQALKDHGLHSGAWRDSLVPDTIERETMMQLGLFGWMSVNITGTVAKVTVSEKYSPEDTKGEEVRPCNIKAKKDGQIVKMDVKSGESIAKLGDAVTKGDLLVSGVVSTESGGDFLSPSIGSVYAETTVEKTVEQPMSYKQSLPSGNFTQRSMLEFLGIRLPLGLSYVPYESYTSQRERLNFISCGSVMPVDIYNEYCTEYKENDISLTKEEAHKSCLAALALYEAFHMQNCEIKKRELKGEIKNNTYVLTAKYTCVEDIGEISYIGVDEGSEDEAANEQGSGAQSESDTAN